MKRLQEGNTIKLQIEEQHSVDVEMLKRIKYGDCHAVLLRSLDKFLPILKCQPVQSSHLPLRPHPLKENTSIFTYFKIKKLKLSS